MKPIKLKIKGLNSFIEEQTIDFIKLSRGGLFGIFGPTGSGKSTILDGITLALYGEMARKSSNYINTNCESANVAFEFQISGSEVKRYKVEREFKTDKKTGNPRSGKCKVMDVTNTEEYLILAEGVKDVTAKCKEIIGLNIDDFTRTVVLPQGKFSEFLKLEGRSRREMLERLFNLQQYGEDLSRKLSFKISSEKTQNNLLIGELKGYEDISEEKGKKKDEEYENSKIKLAMVNKELIEIQKQYKQYEELWNLQMECLKYKKQEQELNKKAEDINNKRKIVKLGESALRVRPFQLIYDNTLKDIGLTEISLDGYKEKIEKLSIKKEEAEKSFEMATDRKHNELPKLKVKEQMVKDAIEEKRIIYGLNKEIIEIGDKISECELKKENKAKKLYNIKDNIIKMNSDIKSLEKNSEELKIDNGVKEKVQRGVLVSEKYNSIYSVVETSKNKIKILEKEINKEEEKAATINSNLIEKIGKLKVSENIMEDLVENSPGESEKLLDMQKILSNAKESWNKYTEYQEEIKKSNLSLMDYTGKLEENKKLKIDIEFNLEKFKSQAKERETENLAHKLRQALNNGDICPVCGSKEHHIENIKSIENIEDEELKELENKIENFEKQLKRIEENITKYKTNTSIIENKIKEYMLKIESLGEDFKKISITELEETFNAFQKSLNDYNKNKKELTVLIEETKEEKGKLEVEINTCTTTIRNKKNQLEQLKIENEKDIENLSNVQKQFNDLKDETGIEDFVKRNREILAAENEIEIILNKVKTNRNILEQLNNDSKSVEENIVEIKSELDRQKIFLEDKNKTIQEKSEIIKMKIGHLENLSEDLDNIEKTIKDIEEKFIEGEKLKQNIYEAYQECNDKLVKTSGKINELYKRRNTEKEELDSNMKNEGFQSVDEINENLISRIEMDKLNIIIDKYNEDLSKIIAVIESVSKKIGNRTLEDEQWKKIQEEKEEKEIQLKNLNEIKIKLEEEVKIIKTKLLELKELLAKKAIIDYKLALLSDLEKLFKGKKFVEFVAATRLKHISAEASVRLKEITNGIYGLKVDENGKFIIRDYKNGGAERDASTLSGGETFLASLSLALALSTEIQLKGTAPLELFFLDEGFGTLDDDLLDVVLSSLEKIHNEKLKVGIISHVESIKNRIPVKLVITPAEAGKGGSKIGTVQ